MKTNGPNVFLKNPWIIGIVVLFMAVIAVLQAVYKTREDQNSITLETSHVASLLPHEHAKADSVSDIGHHQYLLSQMYVAPQDMWISRMDFELVNAPATIVHHVSLLDFNEPHQTCASLPFSQRFILAQDTMHHPGVEFPKGTGMLIKKGDHIMLSLMAHNPLPPLGPGKEYEDVFARLKLSLLTGKQAENLKPVHFRLIHLDDEPCVIREVDQSDAYVFAVPPNSKNYTMSSSNKAQDPSVFKFKKASTILYVGAHVHGWQGGKELVVDKNGKQFLDFKTRVALVDSYRHDTPYYPTTLDMKPGDTLSLHAIYDNPNSVATRGVMGDLGIYYVEE